VGGWGVLLNYPMNLLLTADSRLSIFVADAAYNDITLTNSPSAPRIIAVLRLACLPIIYETVDSRSLTAL